MDSLFDVGVDDVQKRVEFDYQQLVFALLDLVQNYDYLFNFLLTLLTFTQTLDLLVDLLSQVVSIVTVGR